MKDLAGMRDRRSGTPGGRPVCGGSSIAQFFPRARECTYARPNAGGERPIELSLLLNLLPSQGDAREYAYARATPVVGS